MTHFYDPPNAISAAGMSHTTIDDSVTATGTAEAGAYKITKQVTVVGTCGSGAGVQLPAVPGVVFSVKNNGANALSVYPPTGAAIDGGSVDAAVTVAAIGTLSTGPVSRFAVIPSENEQPGETLRVVQL